MLAEFIKFCKSQTGRNIDNTFWSTCAIGEFASTKGISMKWQCPTDVFPELMDELTSLKIGTLVNIYEDDVIKFDVNMACPVSDEMHEESIYDLLNVGIIVDYDTLSAVLSFALNHKNNYGNNVTEFQQ